MKRTKKLLSFFLAIVMVITAIPAFTLTASAATTDVTKSNNENSVTNRVLIDDAIYTYASESAYYNYGTTISTTAPWSTKVYFRNGASNANLSRVTCIDDRSTLSVVNNTLQGNFTDNKFKVSGATDVNATLLFEFNDGTKEYHRVAVKSYPVENHVACEAIKVPGWGRERTESGYTMFMRGSTGAGGLGVWQYQKSYAKSGTGTHGLDGAAILTADKKAYNEGYSEGGNAEPTKIGTATYYIDKSCYGTSWAGLGNSELWYDNNKNYVIPIEVVRTRFFHASGTAKWDFDLNNMPVQNKLKRTDTKDRNDANGTTYGVEFTHNASVDASNRVGGDSTCNVRIAMRTTDKGYALLKTNLIVKLFDKSIARDKYDEYINKNLVESNYTASSFATYQNALLAMEAYLSNYEDTTEADILSDVYINLERAYNNLVPRGDTQAVLNKLAEFNSVATEQSNSNKYTTTSYKNFVDAQWPPSNELTAAINLETDTLAQRELTAALATTYIKAIQDCLDLLVECADFSTLASNYTSAQSKIADESSYTKSSFDEFKAVVDNAVYAKYSDTAKKDTKKSEAQSAIDSESTAIANAIAKLVQRANFEYYDGRVSDAKNALSVYTAKDGQNIRVYRLFEPYKPITLYTDDQMADTPITSQTAVNNVGLAIENANTNINNSSVEGTDYVDQTALKSFTTEFANFDTDVYNETITKQQYTEATGLYKSITFDGTQYFALDVNDQADLNSKLASYLNAINDSLVKYEVTVPSDVSVFVGGIKQTPKTGNTYELYCGENVTFTNNNNDTAWYMEYTSNNAKRGNQYQTYGKSFTTKILGKSTITAEYAVADSTPHYVAIIREYDKAGTGKAIERVNYVANNSVYTLPTPTRIVNYDFAGYVVNGETKAAGDTVTITADTEITAKYQYIGSDLTITVNGTEKKCAYNESVRVSDAGAYAWVEKTGADTWRPFYIGSAVTFRATESTELKSVTEEEFKATFTDEAYAPNLRLNGVIVDADNRVIFHAQRIDYLPTGAQVIEFGILLNKKSSTDFDLGNDKDKGERNEFTVRMKSTQSLDKVQFNIFVKNAGNEKFTYKSYMIYKLADGTVETVYSDVFTKA